ncbi:MAG: hypothetical protein J6F30_15405 [Cellulosilyticum sp.]|nr:hypothetical protein [Cellulosilyticum sp.]
MGDKKKISGKLIGIIVAVVAVLGIGIGIFAFEGQNKSAFKALKGTPEEIVTQALANTSAKSIEEQNMMNTKLGSNQVGKILDEKATEMDFKVVLKDISGVEDAEILSAYIKDIGLSGNLQTTKDYNKFNGNLKLTQSGIELLGLSAYKEEDEFGISIPRILDAPYAIKLSSWLDDYKNSALYNLLGDGAEINEEDINQVTEVIEALGEYMTGAMNLSMNEEFMAQNEALQVQYIKNANIEKNGTQKVTLTDGSEAEWNIYSGTLSGQEVVDLFNKEIELLMNLDFARNYFEVLAEQSGYTVDEMLEEMQATISEDSMTTIDIDFLIDDTYFRGIKLGINKEERLYDLTIQYTGAKYLLDGIDVNLVGVAEEVSGSMDVVFKQNLGDKADQYTQSLTFALGGDSIEAVTMNYNYKYDTKAEEDNLEVDLNVAVDELDMINYNATGTKTIENKEVTTNLTNAALIVNDGTQDCTINFSLGYGIKGIEDKDIVIEKTGVKYLLEMTQEEILKTLETIETNIQSFAYGLI